MDTTTIVGDTNLKSFLEENKIMNINERTGSSFFLSFFLSFLLSFSVAVDSPKPTKATRSADAQLKPPKPTEPKKDKKTAKAKAAAAPKKVKLFGGNLEVR